MKIVSVVGARPQFIKVNPIIEQLNKVDICHRLIHTGQHYDYEMSRIFFDQMNIPVPDYNLEVGSYSHGKQTGLMLQQIEEILLKEKPDFVLVYGDTNSTLAAALAAVKLHFRIAHVEAGLRSFNMSMPEEVNRRITDHISTILFCPTENAVFNLKNENISKGLFNVGDIMFDAFLNASEISQQKSDILQKINVASKNYLLLTIHRAENVDVIEKLNNIIEAIGSRQETFIFPVHPRTKKQLAKLNMTEFKNIHCIEPVGYLDMVCLEKNANIILTDSGGVQKEAYFSKVPCITLREETEWIETLEKGWNTLVGSDKNEINSALDNLTCPTVYDNLYGDGNCAEKITAVLLK